LLTGPTNWLIIKIFDKWSFLNSRNGHIIKISIFKSWDRYIIIIVTFSLFSSCSNRQLIDINSFIFLFFLNWDC
jgi:hypothetical protein